MSNASKALTHILNHSFLVGGAVRDSLLGLAVKDKDHLVVGITEQQMLDAGFNRVGKDFPVFLHPESKEEYALARTEKKQGHGYSGFVCYASPEVTIEQDLMRRDLTINAIAQNKRGELVDPYNGEDDIKQKVLRHVSPAFVEDPLRVLRVARFASRFYPQGFTIASETMQLMQEISASGELEKLSAERIWQETERSLAQPHPDIYFEVLRESGALKVLFPTLEKLWGVPNPAQWHPEICSGIHTMMTLQQAAKLSNKTTVRFAALCHDLGKGLTQEQHWPSHRGHEKAGVPLINELCDKLRIPNEHRRLAVKVSEFHLHCHRAFELKASTLLKMLNALDVWRNPEFYQDFILACQADFLGRAGFEHKTYHQAKFFADILSAAQTVTAKEFIAQGIQGKGIKEAMDKAKLAQIKKVIQRYQNVTQE